MFKRKRPDGTKLVPSPVDVAPIVVAVSTIFSAEAKDTKQKFQQYEDALMVLNSYLREACPEHRLPLMIGVTMCASDLIGTLAAALAEVMEVDVTEITRRIATAHDDR